MKPRALLRPAPTTATGSASKVMPIIGWMHRPYSCTGGGGTSASTCQMSGAQYKHANSCCSADCPGSMACRGIQVAGTMRPAEGRRGCSPLAPASQTLHAFGASPRPPMGPECTAAPSSPASAERQPPNLPWCSRCTARSCACVQTPAPRAGVWVAVPVVRRVWQQSHVRSSERRGLASFCPTSQIGPMWRTAESRRAVSSVSARRFHPPRTLPGNR